MGGEEKCLRSPAGETWEKETIWKAVRRWEDIIKIDFKKGDEGHGLDFSGSG